MKHVFLGVLLVLLLAAAGTRMTSPDAASKLPIIYWVTDPNPARTLQIKTFEQWLKKNNYPPMIVRVDSQNQDASKILIQGVSGVAGDVLDHCGMARLRFISKVGLLEDITEDALKLGCDPSQTFPAVVPDLTVDGRQYVFPCNVAVQLFWVNLATFRKYGFPPPPQRWTFAEFEKMGKEFIEKANAGQSRRTVFFASNSMVQQWRWSMGLDVYNETGTKCTLDDPRNVELLKLVYKWTYEDHILPTSADKSSFDTASGYGGADFQLFNNGNYAMINCGRYALIQFRKFGQMELAVSELPYKEFPVTNISTRASGVYAGGPRKDLAKYFVAYLASEDYNLNIVHDADALPPNPKYTEIDEFKKPKDYPNEWGCHEAFARAAREIAVPISSSPFVLDETANRIINKIQEGFMSKIYTAEQAAEMTVQQVHAEMQRMLEENPNLRPLYEERLALQKKIDEYRAAGRKIPPAWISNPFHRHYYGKIKGWLETAKVETEKKDEAAK